MDEIIPNLFIGDLLDANFVSYRTAQGENDWEIISVTDELPNKSIVHKTTFIRIRYDKGYESYAKTKALDVVARKIDKFLRSGKKVLVHCYQGIERSPLSVAWYLHKKNGITISDAYEIIILKRPSVLYRGDWLTDDAEIFFSPNDTRLRKRVGE